MSVLFKGGTIVNASGRYGADVFADGDTIKAIGTNLDNPADEVVDAELLPLEKAMLTREQRRVVGNRMLLLFVVVGIDSSFMESLRARNLADVGRLQSGIDDSLSRCALHCSWQI